LPVILARISGDPPRRVSGGSPDNFRRDDIAGPHGMYVSNCFNYRKNARTKEIVQEKVSIDIISISHTSNFMIFQINHSIKKLLLKLTSRTTYRLKNLLFFCLHFICIHVFLVISYPFSTVFRRTHGS
jgi:hypothetical protein